MRIAELHHNSSGWRLGVLPAAAAPQEYRELIAGSVFGRNPLEPIVAVTRTTILASRGAAMSKATSREN